MQLIARYFGAAFNSVCISFKLIALLYSKSVDRIFTLTVCVLITKTYDGSLTVTLTLSISQGLGSSYNSKLLTAE